MDVTNVFLHSYHDEEIYMSISLEYIQGTPIPHLIMYAVIISFYMAYNKHLGNGIIILCLFWWLMGLLGQWLIPLFFND